MAKKLGLEKTYAERFGEWALVTGCTGGIGKEYALALAGKGMSLALASRSKGKLDQLKEEIEARFNVKTLIIVADFTDAEASDKVVEALNDHGIEISVLVNNVGILGPHFQPFLELDEKIAKDMVTVNITAAVVLCHKLLPGMVKKKKGAIINIASMASYVIGPYLAEYTATKHFMHSFTESLAIENKHSGVTIQSLCPGQVATEMTKDFAPGPGVPKADVYVESSLATLGYKDRTPGYWAHSLQLCSLAYYPVWLKDLLIEIVYRKNYDYAMEKKQKTQ